MGKWIGRQREVAVDSLCYWHGEIYAQELIHFVGGEIRSMKVTQSCNDNVDVNYDYD